MRTTGFTGITGSTGPGLPRSSQSGPSSNSDLVITQSGKCNIFNSTTSILLNLIDYIGMLNDSEFEFINLGAGSIVIKPGSGVTLYGYSSAGVKLVQYGECIIKRLSLNNFFIHGAVNSLMALDTYELFSARNLNSMYNTARNLISNGDDLGWWNESARMDNYTLVTIPGYAPYYNNISEGIVFAGRHGTRISYSDNIFNFANNSYYIVLTTGLNITTGTIIGRSKTGNNTFKIYYSSSGFVFRCTDNGSVVVTTVKIGTTVSTRVILSLVLSNTAGGVYSFARNNLNTRSGTLTNAIVEPVNADFTIGCDNNVTTGVANPTLNSIDSIIHTVYIYRNTLHSNTDVLNTTNALMSEWNIV